MMTQCVLQKRMMVLFGLWCSLLDANPAAGMEHVPSMQNGIPSLLSAQGAVKQKLPASLHGLQSSNDCPQGLVMSLQV